MASRSSTYKADVMPATTPPAPDAVRNQTPSHQYAAVHLVDFHQDDAVDKAESSSA
jgi:hypothetical protein